MSNNDEYHIRGISRQKCHFNSTKKMKMSRRPMVLTHFSILEVNDNSNFLVVDVNGRCSFIFGASYRHRQTLSNTKMESRTRDAKGPAHITFTLIFVRYLGVHYEHALLEFFL